MNDQPPKPSTSDMTNIVFDRHFNGHGFPGILEISSQTKDGTVGEDLLDQKGMRVSVTRPA